MQKKRKLYILSLFHQCYGRQGSDSCLKKKKKKERKEKETLFHVSVVETKRVKKNSWGAEGKLFFGH